MCVCVCEREREREREREQVTRVLVRISRRMRIIGEGGVRGRGCVVRDGRGKTGRSGETVRKPMCERVGGWVDPPPR